MFAVRIAFRVLWIVATVVMAAGLLFAQAPSADHVADLIIWLVICTLLLTAFLIGLWKRSIVGDVSVLLVGVQLLFASYVAVSIVPSLHSL